MQLHGVSMTTPNIMFGKKPNIIKKVTVFLKQIMFLFNSLKQTHNIYKTSIHPWSTLMVQLNYFIITKRVFFLKPHGPILQNKS